MMILPCPLTRLAALDSAKRYLETLNALLAPGAAVPVKTRRLLAKNCYFVLRHGGQYQSKWLVVRRTSTERVAMASWFRHRNRSKRGGIAIVWILDHATENPDLRVQDFWCEPNPRRSSNG
jgi:hypothetical protein